MIISSDERKQIAAARALELVEPGMRLGLGTGSTATHFVKLLAVRVAAGLDVVGVPTSQATDDLARKNGIRLGDLDDLAPLDLTIDGADELDGSLNLIKGGGGALLREKIVGEASRRMIVVADSDKYVGMLGAFALPVEIVRFASGAIAARIERALADHGAPATPSLRLSGGAPFVSDEGHYIVDCGCGEIADTAALAKSLNDIAGVVDHGLFIGIATGAILGNADGSITQLGEI